MANQSHLDILQQGVEAWNSWRRWNSSIEPDLSGENLDFNNLSEANLSEANLSRTKLEQADLTEARLRRANLRGATLYNADLTEARLTEADLTEANLGEKDLAWFPTWAVEEERNWNFEDRTWLLWRPWKTVRGANLSGATLIGANLTGANLRGANLSGARLSEANFTGANLHGANLSRANLYRTNLFKADLSNADLRRSSLIEANLESATLEGCRVYGISAWSLKLKGAKQQNLNVSGAREPAIMVDSLDVAQFIYLLLNNERIRQVIDTISSKVVLILGRFTPERKVVLEAIRDALRQHGYLPVLFDFDKPAGRDLTETISTLAHMARFIIADITEAKSIPQELQAIVPNLPSVPVQPLLLTSEQEYGMFEHFRGYPWVLDTYYYDNLNEVLASVEAKVISPAETKARELSS